MTRALERRVLVWNTRGERQAFQFGPADRQEAAPFTAEDPNAQIALVTGAWALDLFRATPDTMGRTHRGRPPSAARGGICRPVAPKAPRAASHTITGALPLCDPRHADPERSPWAHS